MSSVNITHIDGIGVDDYYDIQVSLVIDDNPSGECKVLYRGEWVPVDFWIWAALDLREDEDDLININLGTAEALHHALGQAIEAAKKAVDTEVAYRMEDIELERGDDNK